MLQIMGGGRGGFAEAEPDQGYGNRKMKKNRLCDFFMSGAGPRGCCNYFLLRKYRKCHIPEKDQHAIRKWLRAFQEYQHVPCMTAIYVNKENIYELVFKAGGIRKRRRKDLRTENKGS